MNNQVKILKQEVLETVTENILPFWLKMQDKENGGFYGQMKGDGTLVKEANKGGILNARILWSFSAAYRVLGHPEYLEAATRAKDYILHHFIDPEYGGIYWELDYKGNPVDTKSNSMPLVSPSMDSLNMCVPQAMRKLSKHAWRSMTLSKLILSIGNTMDILRLAPESGAR